MFYAQYINKLLNITIYHPQQCCSNKDCNTTSGTDPYFKTYFSQLDTASSWLGTAGSAIQTISGPIPTKLDVAEKAMQSYGIDQKNVVVFIFYAFIAFGLICFFIAGFSKVKPLIQLMVAITELVIIALTFICCVMMIIVVFNLS